MGYVSRSIAAKTRAKPDSPRNILRQMARAELAAMEAAAAAAKPESNPLAALSTMDLIPRLNSRYTRPDHLAPMVTVLEESWVRPTRATCHAPPQHAKTDTVCAWVVATLLRFPHLRIVYASSSATLAETKSAKMRQWARDAGVAISDDTDAKGEWSTTAGGGVVACGVAQGFTGRPADIILLDDPYPDRKHARSKAWQRVVSEFWTDVVEARARDSTSIFVWHTRWMVHDLIGLLKSGKLSSSLSGSRAFQHVHLPAENDNGDPLWEAEFSRELLAAKKANVVAWWSLYMGSPRPEGSQVFRDEYVTYDPVTMRERLDQMPHAFGADFAYTAKTTSDASVLIEFAREGRGPTARYYIRDRISVHVTAPAFGARIAAKKATRPQARIRAYVAGTERGTTDYLTAPAPQGAGVTGVNIMAAVADKLVRALPFSESYNGGRVLLPAGAPWLAEFIDHLTSFTGSGDEDDDDIDAAAAGHDELAGNSMPEIATAGRRSTADLRDTYGGARPSAHGWNTR